MAEAIVIGGVEMAGETLEQLITEGRKKSAIKVERIEFDRYQMRAIARLVRRKLIAPEELADDRFFQCRCCGFNPHEPTIHNWFFALAFNDRRELVALSRLALAMQNQRRLSFRKQTFNRTNV